MVYLLCDIYCVHMVFPEKVTSMQSQSSNVYRITQANFEITQGIFQKTQGKFLKTGKCIAIGISRKSGQKTSLDIRAYPSMAVVSFN